MPRIPGLGWYVAAGTVFLAGLTLAGVLVWRFVATFEPATRFLAPGAVQISIAAPGDYLLWHEHRTVHQGRSFNVPPAMPDGTRYRVQGPDGNLVAVEPYAGMSSEDGDGKSTSVAQFAAPTGGTYRIAVEGLAEPRVMSVAPNRLVPILSFSGEISILLIGALGISVAIGLYGFLRAVETPKGTAVAEESSRKLAGLVYGLQAASMLVGVTLFAGVIINYLRRGEVAGTWLESHFTWQIRTFWWSLAWCVLGIATAIVLVGLVVLLASGVWFVYRIVRGWTELNEGRPMYRA